MTPDNFYKKVDVRFSAEQVRDIDRLVDIRQEFKNRNHLVRCAVIQLIRRENQKLTRGFTGSISERTHASSEQTP